MTIFIDANQELVTWDLIAQAGQFRPYNGRAARNDTVLRWGCNGGQSTYPEGVRVLNRRIILDKHTQWELMSQGNVPMPKVYTARRQWQDDGFPEALRKPRIGQMGTGIAKITRSHTWSPINIYQEYIPKTHEYRAMMVGNISAFFMEKHPPENGDIRWNEHRGAIWTGVPEDGRLRRNVKRIGKKALDALGYDFGAMDVIMAPDGRLLVLEVNSRPEFGRVNAERFARSVLSYLQG